MMLGTQVLSNGSLAVSEVYMADSGMYGCTAENSGGSQRAELHLHVTSTSNNSDALLSASASGSLETARAARIAIANVLPSYVNTLKGSGGRWLHFEVSSAIQV